MARYIDAKLKRTGLKIRKSKRPKKCQLCRVHTSRFRRECAICHHLIAPGCSPIRCWDGALNHCRLCHALIETMKYWRYMGQYPQHYRQINHARHESTKLSYLDFPVEVHVTVLLYLCPLKDILWSETYEDEDWKEREANQINARELSVMYPTSMSRRLGQTFLHYPS